MKREPDPGALSSIFMIGRDTTVSRAQLEVILPHRKIAMIPDSGFIYNKSCSLILNVSSFSPYIEGHDWFFPMHWLLELAALTAGFQSGYELYCQLGDEAAEYCIPSFLQPGAWAKRPFSPDLSSVIPICTSVPEGSLKLAVCPKFAKMRCSVLMTQGSRSATINDIEGAIYKKSFFDRGIK